MRHAHANRDGHGDSYIHAYTDGNRYIHAYTDGNRYIHAYSYRDSDSYRYGNRHVYAYANTDTNRDVRPIHDQSDRRHYRARHGGHRQSQR